MPRGHHHLGKGRGDDDDECLEKDFILLEFKIILFFSNKKLKIIN